jgi:hypothetical protein
MCNNLGVDMDANNGESKSYIWNVEGRPRSVGAFPNTSQKHGTYQITAGREDSDQPDTVATGEQSAIGITGKIHSQLTNEIKKQLAYHQQQVEILKDTLTQLEQISEVPTYTDNSE